MESPFKMRTIGRPGNERWVIENHRGRQARYFVGCEGEEWTEDLGQARLYDNIDNIGHDLQTIQVRELGHLGVTRYTLPVDVTVIGRASWEEVQKYLYGALIIDLDYRHYGQGPSDESLVMVKTDTSSLRLVEENEGSS